MCNWTWSGTWIYFPIIIPVWIAHWQYAFRLPDRCNLLSINLLNWKSTQLLIWGSKCLGPCLPLFSKTLFECLPNICHYYPGILYWYSVSQYNCLVFYWFGYIITTPLFGVELLVGRGRCHRSRTSAAATAGSTFGICP